MMLDYSRTFDGKYRLSFIWEIASTTGTYGPTTILKADSDAQIAPFDLSTIGATYTLEGLVNGSGNFRTNDRGYPAGSAAFSDFFFKGGSVAVEVVSCVCACDYMYEPNGHEAIYLNMSGIGLVTLPATGEGVNSTNVDYNQGVSFPSTATENARTVALVANKTTITGSGQPTCGWEIFLWAWTVAITAPVGVKICIWKATSPIGPDEFLPHPSLWTAFEAIGVDCTNWSPSPPSEGDKNPVAAPKQNCLDCPVAFLAKIELMDAEVIRACLSRYGEACEWRSRLAAWGTIRLFMEFDAQDLTWFWTIELSRVGGAFPGLWKFRGMAVQNVGQINACPQLNFWQVKSAPTNITGPHAHIVELTARADICENGTNDCWGTCTDEVNPDSINFIIGQLHVCVGGLPSDAAITLIRQFFCYEGGGNTSYETLEDYELDASHILSAQLDMINGCWYLTIFMRNEFGDIIAQWNYVGGDTGDGPFGHYQIVSMTGTSCAPQLDI
jgi:hypothetical protein